MRILSKEYVIKFQIYEFSEKAILEIINFLETGIQEKVFSSLYSIRILDSRAIKLNKKFESINAIEAIEILKQNSSK